MGCMSLLGRFALSQGGCADAVTSMDAFLSKPLQGTHTKLIKLLSDEVSKTPTSDNAKETLTSHLLPKLSHRAFLCGRTKAAKLRCLLQSAAAAGQKTD